ncbi:MAG: methyltransferase domain-containing protein [Spirochaetota bacterium]
MNYNGDSYKLHYDVLEQQINFEGTLRPYNYKETHSIMNFMKDIHNKSEGTLKLNFRKLRYINSNAIGIIINFIKYAKKEDKIKLKLIGSNVLTWENKTLPNLTKIWEKLNFEIYDQHFYESQDIIEDDEFIPLLKNQTRLLWPHEKEVLSSMGLKRGMKVADICCGCGDLSLLLAREFNPAIVVGIDHSVPGIEHAKKLQKDLGVKNAEFHLGDATALMIDDESFDFVLCRLSIQIFSKPEQILKELYRITKRNGRIYLLGEDYDLIIGHPNDEQIRSVYDKAGKYGTDMGMDLYNGKKLYTILKDMKLDDIKINPIIVDTSNSDRELFTNMIKSWKKFSVYTIGDTLNIGEDKKEDLLKGYEAHIRTINHPHGYTTWSLIAGSGVKKE